MDAEIRLIGGNEKILIPSLWEWLRSERELRGRVDVIRGTPGEEDLGPALEALVVAVGSGGMATALVTALGTWLSSRGRGDVSITVKTDNGTVRVDAKGVRDALPLLQEVLRNAADEP
ncbi:effector-associated constant component EACC1 [Nonomuraea roseola]|uniref:Uncharacterized protein n=1 Tax=Nonomuraea roseola TaxID=46179 RepID=A0ABV5Q4Y9_9ACTN